MDQTRSTTTPLQRPRRSLRGTALGVAAAALVAAWVPFTVFFVDATQHAPARIVSVKPGSRVITTRTSSGQLIQTASPGSQTFVAQSAPVASRSS